MAAVTLVHIVDSIHSELFTASIPQDHASMMMRCRGTMLQNVKTYGEVDGEWKHVGFRLQMSHTAFIEYINEVAI